MSSPVYRRDDCRFCGSLDQELVLQLAPTPVGADYVPAERLGERQESYPLDLFLCSECGHFQLLDVVDAEVLFRDYVYVSSTSPVFVEHFRRYADEIIDSYAPPDEGLVVEIGSNDGTFLKFFKSKGMRVLGIDPARPIEDQSGKDLRWIRERFLNNVGPLSHVVVHGHTIFEDVQDKGHRIGIDTGAFRTGILTALVLEGTQRRYIQAVERDGTITIQDG